MFRRPAATPEQECHKAPAALGTQVAVYEDSIGQLILQWLRKPTYWSEGSSGTQALWHAYTPEPVTVCVQLVVAGLVTMIFRV